MSVDSRLRQASSELDAVVTQTAIPELSTGTKSRPLGRLLVVAAVVAAIAFPLLFVDVQAPSGVLTLERPFAMSATAETKTAEAILEYINELRAENDIAPLAPNDDLHAYADLHSVAMASNGILGHSDISDLLGPFTIIAENIGYGAGTLMVWDLDTGEKVALDPVMVWDLDTGEKVTSLPAEPAWTGILDAHAASPSHYNNMIDTRFTDAGVGVYFDPAGRLWVTVIFATTSLP